MTFTRSTPDENFCLRFVSAEGHWEFGFTQMLYGFRVRLGRAGNGWVNLDYCAGDRPLYQHIVFNAVRMILTRVPESISEHELEEMFPRQEVKPIWNDEPCLERLLEMATKAKAANDEEARIAA